MNCVHNSVRMVSRARHRSRGNDARKRRWRHIESPQDVEHRGTTDENYDFDKQKLDNIDLRSYFRFSNDDRQLDTEFSQVAGHQPPSLLPLPGVSSPAKGQRVCRSDPARYAKKRDREVPYGMKGGEH